MVSYAGMPEKDQRRRWVHPERHLLFHGGRLLTLTTLGLLGGTIGALGHHWAAIQGVVSLVAGIVMLALALGFAGIVPQLKIPEPDVMGAGGGRMRRLFVRALQSRSRAKPFMVGMFVGLLPCGLTYFALIPTFTLHTLSGGLLMLLFGLGTVPGLLTLGVFGNALLGGLLMNGRFRIGMTRVAAVIMAVMGIAFLYRSLPNL